MELNLAMNFKNQAIQMVVIDSEYITKVDILDSLAASLHSTTALATSAGIFGPSRIPILTVVLLTGPDENDFKVLLGLSFYISDFCRHSEKLLFC